MFGKNIEEMGKHMPGGFFIYKDNEQEEIIYANKQVFEIFGCHNLDEFKKLTNNSFKGMIYQEDYSAIKKTIKKQIANNVDKLDYVEYRIVRKDGQIRFVDDYGHYTTTDAYGGIYYVFISDITEKRERMENDLAIRQSVIEALGQAYQSMWLINDINKDEFSLYRGDVHANDEFISHILKIRKYTDAIKYYIDTQVYIEDRKRLTKELTLNYFLHELKDKNQLNIVHLRDTDKGKRYTRLEIAKIFLPNSKVGLVCGFKDVDNEIKNQLLTEEALKTAKKTQEENRKLKEEKIATSGVANMMSSIASLLTNMPAMTFTKDSRTGIYLACNQSYAEYAHHSEFLMF